MNKDEYDQGYSTGAGSTQDQQRGARDAEMDRARREREQQDQWDALNRQREEAERERRDAEQRARERQTRRPDPQPATSDRGKSNSDSSGRSTATSTPGRGGASGPKTIVTLAGVVIGGALGFKYFPENWIAAGICAAIFGALAAAFYKLIIGVAVAVAALWIWSNVEKDGASTPPADYVPADYAPADIASIAAPAADAAPLPVAATRALQFQNRCRFPLRLSLTWQNAQGVEASGSWDIDAATVPLQLLIADQPVQLADPSVHYHGAGRGEPVVWDGDISRAVNGETLAMRSHVLDVAPEGHYFLALNCDTHVSAQDATSFTGPFLTPPPAPPVEPQAVMREVRFDNQCRLPIRAVIEYEAEPGRRRIPDGYWEIPANTMDFVISDETGKLLRTNNPEILFHAKTKDDTLLWDGSVERTFQSAPLRMRSIQMIVRPAGHFAIPVQCEAPPG